MKAIDEKLSQTFSFRMNGSQKEKIDKISKEFGGLTGRKLVFKLIEHYEANKNESQASSEFTLPMIMQKQFCDRNEVTPLKKIVFTGKEHYLHPIYYYELTENVAQKIKEDFNFEPYGEPNAYLFWHALDLYYHDQKNSFLIRERLGVVLKDDCLEYLDNGVPPHPFYIDRCQFVSDYNDLYSKFSRYATYDNLEKLRRHVAEDIGTDYAQMDMLFPKSAKKP